jgi:hypothetical protein
MSLTQTQKSRGNSAEWVFQIGNLQKLNTCQASGTSWNELDRERVRVASILSTDPRKGIGKRTTRTKTDSVIVILRRPANRKCPDVTTASRLLQRQQGVTFFEDRDLGVDIFFYQARGDRQSDKSPANDCNLFP